MDRGQAALVGLVHLPEVGASLSTLKTAVMSVVIVVTMLEIVLVSAGEVAGLAPVPGTGARARGVTLGPSPARALGAGGAPGRDRGPDA